MHNCNPYSWLQRLLALLLSLSGSESMQGKFRVCGEQLYLFHGGQKAKIVEHQGPDISSVVVYSATISSN